MFRNKKNVMMFAVLLSLSLILSACGGNTQSTGTSGTTGKKTEIVIAQRADAPSLDPHASNDSAASNVKIQIFNSLVKTDLNMEMVGDLAESWQILDDLTWQFNLRKGVKWHNGEDFTAADIKYTVERMKVSPQVGHLVEAISEVEILDDHTVLLRTDEPYAPMLANLSHSAARIVNQKAIEEYGEEVGENPIGTGPFKFAEWVSGERIVLERFEEYFEGPAAAERLVFRPIPEGTSRTIALETGEIDIAYEIEPNDKAIVEENDETKLYEQNSNRTEYLSFNLNKTPFENQKVRQAISHVIDKQSILEVAEVGRGGIAHTVIGPKVLGFNPDVPQYDFNVEKAKQLLTEAGYPDGFSTTLWASGDVRERMAQVIQNNLAQIGIDASIQLLEWGAYLDRAAKGEHDMFLLGWTNLTADGDGGMYPLFHSSKLGPGGNRSFYSNPEVDALLEEGRVTVDPEIRPESYKKAQLIIMEDAPWVPLYYQTVNLGARADLKGVELHPGSMHRFYNVSY